MKIMELAIAIKGKLDNSLAGSMQKAISESKTLQAQIKNANKAMQQAQLAASREQKAAGNVSAAQYREIAAIQARINQLTERRADILDKTAAKQQAQSRLSHAAGNVGKAAGVIVAGSAPLASMISTAANFEQAMSKVKAITNSSNDDMARLTSTAQQLGASTQFSATQAAEAMTYLGMAGWKTDQIISGMPGLLNLAAASGSDLGTVADIVSDDLTAFGMSADQAAHMADVMAATSTNANTNVEMMGMTFKYVGSLAGALGYSLEDVSVATGIMANAGIKGEQAGTSLRAIMTRLVDPPKEAATAMDALGISVTNSDGTMKPFMQTMEELRGKFAGMSEAEKAQYASTLAGQEAMSGFLAIVNTSDDDFNKLCDAVGNADGAADRMAKTMQDNAKGGAVQLQSAIEGVSIAIGSIFLPAIAQVVGSMAETVGGIAAWAQEHQKLIGAITYTAAAVAALVLTVLTINTAVAGVNYMVKSFELYRTVIGEANIATKAYGVAVRIAGAAQAFFNAVMAANPLAIAVLAIVALGAALVYLFNTNQDFHDAVISAWEEIKSAAMEVWSAIAPIVTAAWDIIKSAASSGLAVLKEVWAQIAPSVQTSFSAIVPIAITVVNFLKNIFIIGFKVIATVIKVAILTVSIIINGLVGVVSRIWHVLSTGASAAWAIITTTISTAVALVGAIVETLKPIFSAVWTVIITVAKVAFIALSVVAIPIIAAIGMAMTILGAVISTVWQGIKFVAVGVWYAIQGAAAIAMATIAPLIEMGGAVINAVWQGILMVASYVWDAISAAAVVAWTMIQFAFTTAFAILQALASAALSYICSVWVTIYSTAVSCWNAIVDTVSSVWSSIIGIVEQGVAAVTDKWNSLKSIFATPINAVVNFIKSGSSEAAAEAGDAVGENAAGGVYSHPLLTWVAEAGDTEVIVPINNKARSLALWQTAGHMLGALPAQAPATQIQSMASQATAPVNIPAMPAMSAEMSVLQQQSYQITNEAAKPVDMEAMPIAKEPPAINQKMALNVNFSPNINISGQTDTGVVDLIKKTLAEQKAQFERELPAMVARMKANERRLSYV